MISSSTEKTQLRNFMNFNFKWSSKNMKVKLQDIAAEIKNQPQEFRKAYKSYRVNKVENGNHFSSYTRNAKEEKIDMATQLAALQTQIQKRESLRLKDRDIILNIMGFLAGIFKNVPSFSYIIEYLDRYIYCDPHKHREEIMVMKQKCDVFEDTRVSFKEMFDNIDKLVGQAHEKIRERCEGLKINNGQLSDQIFKVQRINEHLQKKLNAQNDKFKTVTALQKEKTELLQHCLKSNFELIMARKTIKTLSAENRDLRITDEEFKFFKIDTSKRAKSSAGRIVELQEEIKVLKDEQVRRLTAQENLRYMIENCNQDLTSHHKKIKTCLENLRKAKAVDQDLRFSIQKRFSNVVSQALQARSFFDATLKQNNNFARRSTKVFTNIINEMQMIEDQISPDHRNSAQFNEGINVRIDKIRNTVTSESRKATVDRESYFLNSKHEHEHSDNTLSDILRDCYDYLSANSVDPNMRGIAFDLIKLLSNDFKNIQKKFIEYLLAFKSHIEA